MATHSSTLAWKIPWMEELGRLQSVGSLGVGHDWATSLSLFTFMHWRRKWQPLQCSCLENPRDGGAWRAAVYGVAQSGTRLKRLSSSSKLYTECQELGFEYSVYILALTIELTPWFSILFCHWEWANHVSQNPSFLTYTVKRLDQMISKIFTSHRILLFSSSYFILGGF